MWGDRASAIRACHDEVGGDDDGAQRGRTPGPQLGPLRHPWSTALRWRRGRLGYPDRVRPATDADAPPSPHCTPHQISRGIPLRARARLPSAPVPPDQPLTADSFLLMADRAARSGLHRRFDGRGRAVPSPSSGTTGSRPRCGGRPLVRGWRRVLETLGHGQVGRRRGRGGPELLSIAVDPAWQGRGAGRMLVAAFLDEVVTRGGGAAHVVVGADNRGAVAFYEQAGFVDRRALRAPRRHRVPAHAVGSAHHRPAGGSLSERSLIAVIALSSHWRSPRCDVAARRIGIVDRPGAAQAPGEAVPYLGGVAVFAGAPSAWPRADHGDGALGRRPVPGRGRRSLRPPGRCCA